MILTSVGMFSSHDPMMFISSAKMLYLVPIVLVLGLCYRLLQSGSRKPGMPPGPPTIPVLGNVHQIPAKRIHEKYLPLALFHHLSKVYADIEHRFVEWSQQYGKIFSLKFGPGDTIVLCDRKAVHDLLDKKGNIYSDRPDSYLAEILGVKENIFVSSLDNSWKEKRKIISHNLSPAQLDKKHFRVQEAE
jgi:hypothetical protein